MKPKWKIWTTIALLLLVTLIVLDARVNAVATSAQEDGIVFDVSKPARPKISPAVRDLESVPNRPMFSREINPLQWLDENIGQMGRVIGMDPLAASGFNANGTTPPVLIDFEGLGTDGYAPPDTIGDVGPNHYIQMVNISFQIWDKGDPDNGILPAIVKEDTPFNQLFTGFGGPCETRNDGDPIVIYDDMADRWMMTQFAISAQLQCMAVSTTSDPMGTYYLYAFTMPAFPDYPKFGAWPDGYYIGTNTGYPNQYYAHVVDRQSMLVGAEAVRQSFGGYPNFMMPADVDGLTPPPAGSPGIFYTMLANGYANHPPGVDRLAIYEFDVDWTTPDNSTFTLVTELPIADYNYTVCGFFVQNCIPQQGTSRKIDSLSYWPMWRLQYRNFGSYEAMVGNFTVDLDNTNKAAIRWFEMRKQSGVYSLFQEGTYAPDNDHRWMGSIAMDASGNIALGYSVSGDTSKPSIRYATRLASDPPGTLGAEQSIIEGGGAQTSINRWGDYAAMVVDPADGCHFWFTSEYHDVNDSGFNWNTRVGVFKIPNCGGTGGGLIFADDFESGDFSAWSSFTNSSYLTVAPNAAISNTYGMSTTINYPDMLTVVDTNPNAETQYRARFYLDTNSISMSNGDSILIFAGHSNAQNAVVAVQLRYDNGYRIRAFIRQDNGGWLGSRLYLISDGPHAIEIDWRAATSAGANNGLLALWIDGVKKYDVAGVDNDTHQIDYIKMGVVEMTSSGITGALCFDAFESRNDAYIGTVSGITGCGN